jgi:dTDP-glucose 4,6-dehydratase
VRGFVRYTSRADHGALDDLPPDVAREVEVYRGDLRDADAVQRAVRDCRIVFHLGAVIAIPYSYVHPLEFVQTNVIGTANVLHACLAAPSVERLVHASTSEVYGSARYVPIDEQHPLSAQSPYAASKVGADQLVQSYHLSFGLPAAIVRPFNTYGPRQSARAIVPTIALQALAGQGIELGSLSPLRDLTYVTDTAAGFVAAAESSQAVGEVMNLGTGQDISVGDLVKVVLDLLGRDLPVVSRQERVRPAASEVMHLRSDNAKARELLHWSPQVTLAEGLRRTIDWLGGHGERYRAEVYQL